MMLKKLAAMAAVIMLAGTAVLSGCSSEGETSQSASASAEDTKSEVKLGEYKGIAVTVESLPDVTDDEVEQMVQSSVENSTVSGQITDRAVAQGDTVNVNYTGYMDDEEIPDSSVEDYNMLIGSGIFFNGAESGLVGVMPGETVDISVTYPEGYPQEDLVGKTAVYKVTVNYIVQEEQAQLTDEFVASISDCETVDEYRQMIREALEASRENEREMNRRNAVWEQVLENAQVISYSQADIDAIVGEYTSYDEAAAEDFGISLEEYVQTYQDMTMDEYNSSVEELAQNEIKNELVIDAIAEAESITGADITDEEMERCAQEQGYETLDDYKNDNDAAAMEEDAKALRVVDFVVNQAQITEQ